MKKFILPIFIGILSCCSLFATPKKYSITCEPSDFEKIYKNYGEDIYIPISFRDGDKVWDDVKMRVRGDGSRALPKKSLKIKFYGEPFSNGKFKLNFNAGYEEKSYTSTILTSTLFRETGQPCFEANYAQLYLNGQFLGIYIQIENIDEMFLEKHNYDPKGNLYKATKDGATLSRFDDYKALFEKKTNEKGSWSDLETLIQELDTVKIENYYSYLNKNFEYERLINSIAVNLLASNFSTYYHNYYMYHDIHNTGKWSFIPWDLDKSMHIYGHYLPYERTSSFYAPDNPLIEKLFINQQTFDDLINRTKEIRQNIFTDSRYIKRIDSLESELEPFIMLDKTDDIKNEEEWKAMVQKNRDYIKVRYDGLINQYKHFPKNFIVHRTAQYLSGEVKLSWDAAENPQDDEIKYVVYYNNKKYVTGEGYKTITTTDTTAILEGLQTGELYRWFVTAENSAGEIKGYDNYNYFFYREDDVSIPCKINANLKLTKDGSPYVVNCPVEISKSATLEIEAGVKLIFKNSGSLNISGGMIVLGSKDEKVIFEPDSYSNDNYKINFTDANRPCIFDYLESYHSEYRIKNSNTQFNNCTFDNKTNGTAYFFAFIKNEGGEMTVNKCNFISNGSIGEGIVSYENKTIVKNSSFENIPDAIEYIRINEGEISNNTINNSPDDAIDLNGCSNIKVTHNFITNINDKAISIGLRGDTISKSINISRNIIVSAGTGVALKNSASAHITNNNFLNCTTGLFYDENKGYNNEEITIIENNIFFENITNMDTNPESTGKTVHYNLYSKGSLIGENNITGNPQFSNIADNNFKIKSTSPCVDAGNPNSPKDSDGSIIDIGAIPYSNNSGNSHTNGIIINEIMFNDRFEVGDWVELYNTGDKSISLKDYKLTDEKNRQYFKIPANVVVAPKEYYILCRDIKKFIQFYKIESDNISGQWYDFGFGSADAVVLRNAHNSIIDSVGYTVDIKNFNEAYGTGYTLELIDNTLDNSDLDNWDVSTTMNGTPLKCNSVSDCNNPPVEPTSQKNSILIFPIPLNKQEISATLDIKVKGIYDLKIYDLAGKEILTIFNKKELEISKMTIPLNLNNFRPGIYFCSLLDTKRNSDTIFKFVITE